LWEQKKAIGGLFQDGGEEETFGNAFKECMATERKLGEVTKEGQEESLSGILGGRILGKGEEKNSLKNGLERR